MKSLAIAFKEVLKNPETAADLIAHQIHDPSYCAKDLKPCDLDQKLLSILESRKFQSDEKTKLCKEIVEATAFWQDDNNIYAMRGLDDQKNLKTQIPLMDYLFAYLTHEIQVHEIESGQSDLAKPKAMTAILVNISGRALPDLDLPSITS